MDSSREKFDPQNLHQVIVDLPNQILKAWDFTDVKLPESTKKIFVFGIGGSALPANILKTYLNNSATVFNLPIRIVRDYDLPKDFDDTSAGFFISFSGNTEETLSCFSQARQRNHQNLVVITAGGELKKQAQENNLPLIEIPSDCLQPRMGYGYFFGALLKILVNSNFLQASRDEIQADVTALLNENKNYEATGQKLAEILKDKVPIIYTSDKWKYLAMIIKINFNENTKIQSFWNTFPEFNHNEMVGYTKLLGNYAVLVFQDPEDHERTKKRQQIFKELFQDKMPIEILDMPQASVIQKIFSTLMTGLWTSYYLALAYEINPLPVALVEQFKDLMKK